MDMTLGLPAASLRPLGLGDLPADYVFPIPVRGTSAKPQVDLIRRACCPCPLPGDCTLRCQRAHQPPGKALRSAHIR